MPRIGANIASDLKTLDESGASEDLLAGQETDWAYLKAMTDDEAHRNALADEDNPPLTDAQLARMRRVPRPREIRERLGLTRREFSKQFQIALGTLRDWEQGARRPDSAAKAYLRVIEQDPTAVLAVLDPTACLPTLPAPRSDELNAATIGTRRRP